MLVEGDEESDPIAEEVRSILDGHIVLSRKIALANRYPAIDVLASLSRVMPLVASRAHQQAAARVRELIAKYQEIELLVQIGEYREGSDRLGDLALRARDLLGSQPPPPVACCGCRRRSSRWPCRSERTSSGDASRRCMKLQKPPRLHSPFSFCRQHASRKSVTGESSAQSGRSAHAKSAWRASTCAAPLTVVPPVIERVDGALRLLLPLKACVHVADEVVADVVAHLRRVSTRAGKMNPTVLTWSSSRCPNFASSQ